MQKLRLGSTAKLRFGDKKLIRVKYVDLVVDAEFTLTDLFKKIGLIYDKALLEGRTFQVPEYTCSQHALFGCNLDKKRTSSWRQSLSQKNTVFLNQLPTIFW